MLTFGAILVYLFCQNTGTSCLSNTPGAAKKKGLCKVVVGDGIFKGIGNSLLAHHIFKGLRTIFTCRYYKRFQNGMIIAIYKYRNRSDVSIRYSPHSANFYQQLDYLCECRPPYRADDKCQRGKSGHHSAA